jgi:hypothetical protein
MQVKAKDAVSAQDGINIPGACQETSPKKAPDLSPAPVRKTLRKTYGLM